MNQPAANIETTNTTSVDNHSAHAAVIELARQLISIDSITPNDKGCQQILAAKLEQMGFKCTHLPVNGISNLIAELGDSGPVLAFSGHTDVVSAGDENKWLHHPFEAQISQGNLYGRGIADMKGAIAAQLCALQRYLEEKPLNFRLMLLITSDEEGEADYGTKAMVQYLKDNNKSIHCCLIGEPSCDKKVGDTIKVGRRGAVSGRIKISGKQGHVAYPHLAKNAIYMACDVINRLKNIQWTDQGCHDFPGTSLQITHLDTGEFVDNIIPGTTDVCFNIRYTDKYSEKQIIDLVTQAISPELPDADIHWSHSCSAYLSSLEHNQQPKLIDCLEKAIVKNVGILPKLSTSGGASDGRFIAQICSQVVEFGLLNKTIHQINEHANINDIIQLEILYFDMFQNFGDAVIAANSTDT